ncbi:MAG: dipicolinate synthase subunit B [Clostridia bacterium]|nr:dipicolinate synthase subunit B [Clostridia bacterium]MBQ4645099.1 dipicolinate synthase subunit B [Clostridia bacterium]
MSKETVGFALCGSFCTFKKVIPQIEKLVNEGYRVIPIMSHMAYTTDTRFGKARDFNEQIERICKENIIYTISGAEPIGPKELLDVLVIAPCTGNTLGKLANGISDTSVTLAVKAHLRNQRPVIIAVSSNDALGTSARNIGTLMNSKNIYFVPMEQDDYINKPNSIVADFRYIPDTVREVLATNKQPQPILL